MQKKSSNLAKRGVKTEVMTLPNSTPSPRAFEILKETFGFSAFRGEQGEVIGELEAGRPALLLMPTGMGKSLCYQLPARLFSEHRRGLTLVISPLISLMKDQVDAALAKGLRAAFINSSLSCEERAARYRKLAKGDYELVYVTPERFRIPEFRESLTAGRPISLLAVDEAHCISSWGHDFRPDYSRLGDIRAELGNPLTLALTATATPQVAGDILEQLKLSDARVFNSGVARPNLALAVHDVHGLDDKIRAFIGLRHAHPGPAILYFSLIGTLKKFSDEISRLGVKHLTYHGQMWDPLESTCRHASLSIL